MWFKWDWRHRLREGDAGAGQAGEKERGEFGETAQLVKCTIMGPEVNPQQTH